MRSAARRSSKKLPCHVQRASERRPASCVQACKIFGRGRATRPRARRRPPMTSESGRTARTTRRSRTGRDPLARRRALRRAAAAARERGAARGRASGEEAGVAPPARDGLPEVMARPSAAGGPAPRAARGRAQLRAQHGGRCRSTASICEPAMFGSVAPEVSVGVEARGPGPEQYSCRASCPGRAVAARVLWWG